MKTTSMITTLLVLFVAGVSHAADPVASPKPGATKPEAKAAAPQCRLAIFDLAAAKRSPIESEALTDGVTAVCSMIPNVTLVDRKELMRVASEHKMSLSGMSDTGKGVKLGRFVAATHILVGRLSTIGQSNYLVLKLVDVETTEQRVISVRTTAADEPDKLFETLEAELKAALTPPAPAEEDADKIEDLRKAIGWLKGQTVLVDVSEKHVARSLPDPACATAAFNMLRELGVNAVLPNRPPKLWKEVLIATGKYQDAKVDYLLEGEGVSSFAAELQGMTSCRARVELKLVPVPGREVMFVETGVGAEVDLAEALAAKSALEEATQQALSKLILRGHKRLTGDDQ